MICTNCSAVIQDKEEFCFAYGLCHECMESKIIDDCDIYYYNLRQLTFYPSQPCVAIYEKNTRNILEIISREQLENRKLKKKINDDRIISEISDKCFYNEGDFRK